MKCVPGVDVAVIGGGPAGTALALTLRLYYGLSVAVVEQSGYEDIRIGENVSGSLLPFLDYLQVKETFLGDNHLPVYTHLAAWGSSSLTERYSLFTSQGEGFMLDRGLFDSMLAEAVFNQGGKLYLKTKYLKSEQLDSDAWLLQLHHYSGEEFSIEARYFVDATGRQARVARKLGAKSLVYDRLIGVCSYFECLEQQSNRQEVLVESVPEGWWYSAPLPNERLVVALITDTDILQEEKANQYKGWSKLLLQTRYTIQRVWGGTAVAPLTVKVAHSHILTPAVGDRWMAVGDAAAAFDPLSSLGIGHAIASGCSGAVAIADNLNGKDQLLQEYYSQLKINFENYLQMRHSNYQIEQRWNTAPFWQRRRVLINSPIVEK